MKTLYTLFFLLLFSAGNLLAINSSSLLKSTSQDYFIMNQGQWDSEVLLAANLNQYNLIIKSDGIIYDYQQKTEDGLILGHAVKFAFNKSNQNVWISGQEDSKEYINYLYGDKSKWIKNVMTFKKVRVNNIWDGVSLDLYFEDSKLRYDFVVSAKANPDQIKFDIEGANSITLKSNEFLYETRFGSVSNKDLFTYQLNNNKKEKVSSKFTLSGNQLSFTLGAYNDDQELIIDPLVFTSFEGSTLDDYAKSIKYLENGSFVIAGESASTQPPATSGEYTGDYVGGIDVFVAKYTQSYNNLTREFITYLGSTGDDNLTDLAVDTYGNIYLCGYTASADFPQVAGTQQAKNDNVDGFVLKMNSDGSEILFSNFLGGRDDDLVNAIDLNSQNEILVVGQTNSVDFPTRNAYETVLGGPLDGFLSKYDNNGTQILYSSYFGGSAYDWLTDIFVTSNNSVLLIGTTNSSNIPVKPYRKWGQNLLERPFDYEYNGKYDAFMMYLQESLAELEFCTYYGGTEDDYGKKIWGLSNGKCYFIGETITEPDELTFPVSSSAFQNEPKGRREVFFGSLNEVKKSGHWQKVQEMDFATFLGGTQDDFAHDIIKDEENNKFIIIGGTKSSDFPIIGVDGEKGTRLEGFISKLSIDGSSCTYSNTFGSSKDEEFLSVCIDDSYGLLLAGYTNSSEFTRDGFIGDNHDYAGNYDALIAKFNFGELEILEPSGNQSYCKSEDLNIEWTLKNAFKSQESRIYVQKEETEDWNLIGNVDQGTSYNWDIPDDLESGNYKLMIVNENGTLQINSSTFTILDSPSLISLSSEGETVELCENDEFTLTADAEGPGVQYHWLFNDEIIPNENTSSFVIDAVKNDNQGEYKVQVYGTCDPSITSDPVSLVINPETAIQSLSADTTCDVNTKLSIYVEALGKNLVYQWYKDDQILHDYTSNTIIIDNCVYADSGYYHCVISGDCGEEKTSDKILVNVVDPISVEENSLANLKLQNINYHSNILRFEIESNLFREVSIEIYDLNSNKISNQFNKELSIGKNILEIPVRISNGVYFLRIVSGEEVHSIKFNIIK